MAVFLRPYAVVRLLWAGDGGEGSRPAGSLGRRSSNLGICPPTPFGSGERDNNLSKEATMALRIFARPAQPISHAAHTGYQAARLWLANPCPSVSLAQWRENRWQVFCISHTIQNKVRAAFDKGFADALASHISGRV